MSKSSFRARIESAIERREPLDSPELQRLAETATIEERDEWRRQLQLDAAVGEWRRRFDRSPRVDRNAEVSTANATVGRASWRAVSSAKASAALALSLSALILWIQRELPDASVSWSGAAADVETDLLIDASPISTVSAVAAPKPVSDIEAPAAPRPTQPDRFAQASVTVERLAYAFQPVGQDLGEMVWILIDAMPGRDVFAM